MRLTRRSLLGALLAAPAAARPPGLASAAPMIAPRLVERALAALFGNHAAIWSRDVIAIADFSLPSSAPRFFLVDIVRGQTTSLLVTHGKGSDPDHSGWLQNFSDSIGSAATSEGAYLTGDAYTGIHGPSRRLIGLDPTNAHAEERAIVIHSAWYANADMIVRQGKLGRSDGCFAFGEADIAMVLARLGRGRLLYAGRSDG
ncbi:murein L,D-transpeptidase catalytic domain family protein [Sphingomonadaceae bacterium G21617-S1]|uniref:murein L,D-transpeptidase catalytic domain family protein n=1 Tax=Rhizorhabdus sp. TaxID=1968843 RepID=UPI00199FAFB3|nr:murein L,D-transpeptidase catalytic domain family protein [Rhizorhabdus sp.]MBD3759946.1 murein L,D-transpeptidase catalytic domain family protein [Rhizorhabdus sp.]MCZ4343112.1 murein L,D-transpeptidase catalytic domain family protein [Sphingomonadaceae bacterium G21617-S1]